MFCVEHAQRTPGPWQQELDSHTRAFSGAFLFGIPLLLTVVPLLALELGFWHEVALVLTTVVLTYAIVCESGFTPQVPRGLRAGLLQHPYTETVFAYLLALGLPAAVGGAAGRLVV